MYPPADPSLGWTNIHPVRKHITGFGHIFENIPMEHFSHHTANSHIQQ